jgi:hypothetical protein
VTPSRQTARLSRGGLLCAVLFVLVIAAAYPVAASGVSDDWSYIKTAQVFAQTGHIVYNGWATAMLGWLMPWGALAAKLFGPSYTAIRLSMVPLAALCALLLERILRGFGLNRAHAIFGTLVLVLSPVFLSMSTMFMTDTPGVLSVLLCIYLCQRALEAETDRAALAWLVAAGVTNVLSGTVRQIAWLGVLVMVPCCGWLLRRRRHVPLVTVVLWLASGAAIFASIHWLDSQPFTIPEKLIPGKLDLAIVPNLLHALVVMAVTTMLICLPVFALALSNWRSLSVRSILRFAAVMVVFAAIFLTWRHVHPAMGIPFWMHDVMPHDATLTTNNIPGLTTADTSRSMRFGIEVVLVACVGTFAALSWRRAPQRDQEPLGATLPQRWSNLLVLLVPFVLAYTGMLLPRATFVELYDRYLLVPAAVVLVLLLRLHQERMNVRVRWPGIAMLGICATVGLASTHDLFSLYRARVRLADEITRTGVPRSALRAGFEYDAITQVDAWDSLNDPRVVIPGHPFVALPESKQSSPCNYWFARFTPAVQPRYVITRGPDPALPQAGFGPVGYDTWLPPGRHSLYAERTSGCR